ncbi:MAG TPA: twin-arginine translocase TatA/TatE family subunit [Acidimicrobiia bacterium]|nr:twin-arginine translocase TatA/TatE family subunit [Acidimicrobiia bacterium]
MSIGPAEILVILIVALIVFGPQRLPEVGRQVGSAMRELRKVQETVRSEIDGVLNTTTSSPPAATREERGHIVPPRPAIEAPDAELPEAPELIAPPENESFI